MRRRGGGGGGVDLVTKDGTANYPVLYTVKTMSRSGFHAEGPATCQRERERERANARRVVFIYRFTSWGKCYFFFSVTLLLLSYPVFFFFLLASSNFYFKSLRKIKRRKKSRRDRYLHHTPTEMYKYSRHCNSV